MPSVVNHQNIDEQVADRWNSGASCKAIMTEFDIPYDRIRRIKYRLGLSSHISHPTTRCTVLTKDAHSILTGLMLGDGSLIQSSKARTPYFSIASIQPNYIKSLMTELPFEWGEPQIVPAREEIIKGQLCKCQETWYAHTRSDVSLISWRQFWYPRGIKTIPSGLVLTPFSILHWFLNDGSSTYRKNSSSNILVSFATNGFTHNECQLLCQKLKEADRRLLFAAHKNHTHWAIQASHHLTVQAFFDYIGPCPYPCFEYKWKIPQPVKRKLTSSQIDEIKKMRLAGMRLNELAEIFNISPAFVCNIAKGQRYRY